jgi:hypothetical protein
MYKACAKIRHAGVSLHPGMGQRLWRIANFVHGMQGTRVGDLAIGNAR